MTRRAIVVVALGLLASFALGWWLGPGAPAPDTAADRAAVASDAAETGERKILYYRHPMGLPDTSPIPKKDAMGMDYVPVYADDGGHPEGMVVIGPEKVQTLGVRTAVVERRALRRTIRASARIAVDEGRLHTVAPKVAGWIERLEANQTGMPVRRGATLARIYSPELVSAQEEYVIATRALGRLGDSASQPGMQALADAALLRLRNWDIPAAEIAALERGEVRRTLTLASPVDAVVLEKRAVEGMRFMAGEVLFELADLSEVWLVAEITILDLPAVAPGQTLRFATPALPGEFFAGSVSFIYPTLSEATRSVKVRATLPNPRGILRPALVGQAEIDAGDDVPRTLVPHSAVIDSGIRQIVLVAHDAGRFEPRAVRLGLRGDELIEVLDGVEEGETVVVSANFLIDAESSLKSALSGLGAHGGHGAAPQDAEPPADTPATDPHEDH